MSNELKTPEAWSLILGVQILDADGWADPQAPTWFTEISKSEFVRRMSISTVRLTGEVTWKEFAERCKS
jgi:hypothetical protein